MIDYSEITDGIIAVVDEGTPVLLSFPKDVISMSGLTQTNIEQI